MTMAVAGMHQGSAHVVSTRGRGVSARKVRLNWRGRLFVATVAASVAMWIGFAVLGGEPAQSVSGPAAVSSYTVRPGDTMWEFAASITPAGGDVSRTVDELLKLNNLSDPALEVGQRLIVPQP